MPAVTIIVETVIARTLREAQALEPEAFREMLRGLAARFEFESHAAEHSPIVNPCCSCELCVNGEQPAF